MHYRYQAIDAGMRRVSGELEADSLQALEDRLLADGLELVSAREQRPGRTPPPTRSELADFCTQVEQLLNAGIPLVEALQALADSGEGARLPALCRRLERKLVGGQALSQALAEERLDPALTGVVQAGEFSGRLPDSLRRLSDNLNQREALARTTKKLLLQPLLAGSMVLAASLFLMLYLVPQIRDFLAETQQSLPLASILLFASADLLAAHWPWLAAPPLLLALTLPLIARRPGGALELSRLGLRLPLIGGIRRRLLIAHLAELLALLYGSGIPLLTALGSLPATMGNRAAADVVGHIARDVEQGSGLAEAFARHDLFPPLLIRILHAGERSGTLEQALLNIGRRCASEAADHIAVAQALLAPTLTLLIGALLGWIMLATIQPLYGLIDAGMR